MTLETGRKTTWDEIEVGEVFAADGCWAIFWKVSNYSAMWIANDRDSGVSEYTPIEEFRGRRFFGMSWCSWTIYKLPQSVQRLWRT